MTDHCLPLFMVPTDLEANQGMHSFLQPSNPLHPWVEQDSACGVLWGNH